MAIDRTCHRVRGPLESDRCTEIGRPSAWHGDWRSPV